MARKKATVAEIVAGEPTVEEELAAVAAASTPAGIESKPPILAVPAGHSNEDEVVDEDEDEEEAPTRVPLKQRLGDLDDTDLEELFQLATVSDRLQKQAEERAGEIERQERERVSRENEDRTAREDQEFLRRLRKTDPVAYNEELDKREAQEEERKSQVKQIRAVTDEFTRRLGVFVDTKIDPVVASKFKGKDYSRLDLIDGVIQYMDDLMQEERSTMRRTVEKELEPVLRKKILTELNGGDEQPQIANTTTSRSKPREKMNFQTETEVGEAFAKGLAGLPGGITKEQMIDWYKTHGRPR